MANITFEQRKEIEKLIPVCRSKREVAMILKIPSTTLNNELNRNSVNGKYDAESAQQLADIRAKHKYIRKPGTPDTALSMFIQLKDQIEILKTHLEIIMEHLKL